MRRSPLQRKTPIRQRAEGPSFAREGKPMARESRPAKCKHCKQRLGERERGIHTDCVEGWYAANRAKLARAAERKKEREARAERAQDRKTREERKTLPTLHKEARYWFNRWIRLRDAKQPCISCGAPPPDLSGLHAGRDAGHYRSVGSAGHLRYTEANVAAQCVHCNQYLAGNPVGYRRGLIERRGPDVVEALEDNNQPEKWQREQVRAIRDEYKARCKELEKRSK